MATFPAAARDIARFGVNGGDIRSSYAVHTDRLEAIVQAAVIRRWNVTEPYRTLLPSVSPSTAKPYHSTNTTITSILEIDKEVENALGP